ncbi:MAG: hypothetical protein Q7T10_16725 [Rhodoferax sp.]|uniref:hypothetical protein n=1 Tax=Rhodoferax sp. TaxID=50421 RepID=UPI0027225B9A|nr:hypothetical protein [Rhodoferax sp.]MDO8450442.1 hypothetical protein [Rhodoferax sp.]
MVIRLRRILALAGLALAAASLWAQQAPVSPRHGRAHLASGVAFAPDGRLWLAGLNEHGQLFVQSAPASDLRRWDAPRVIATAGDALSADGENRPKLAFGPTGWAVISYTQPLAKPYTGMIRMLRSTDGGQTFSAPFTVHADRQEITHRFDSVAFDAQGVLHTVWIDKRDMERAPKVGKKSSYAGAAIYRNESRDGGASFGPDLRVADHSCECCRIALAPGRDGVLRAMWRHVFEPNVRDHGFAVLAPQGSGQVVRATFDDWHIDACPHHGPGLALAADDGFHAVWFGIRKQGAEDVAAVRYARLRPDGNPQLDTVRMLPDERAEHADVLAWGDRVAVVWRSVDGAHSTLKAWLSTDSGQTFRLAVLGSVMGDNDHPRLAQQGGRMVAVWRNAKEVQVHEIRF